MMTPKAWGFEDLIVNAAFCGKRLVVRDRYRSSVHMHKVKDEALCVSSGLVWFETGASPEAMVGNWMQENDRIRITPGLWHRFAAINGDAVIHEFSTHHDDADSVRNNASGKMGDDEYRALLSDYVRDQASSSTLPAMSVDHAGAIAISYRSLGATIGMCNGCFDLMHVGHLSLLREAKNRCQVLFVGVNNDASVRKLKGPSRPYVPQEARCLMVASTRFADHVVLIEDLTCVELVRAIKPDVYVTTTECRHKAPEAPETVRLGGKVDAIEMVPGFNTTGLAALAASRARG